jgi:hypothetical protein
VFPCSFSNRPFVCDSGWRTGLKKIQKNILKNFEMVGALKSNIPQVTRVTGVCPASLLCSVALFPRVLPVSNRWPSIRKL